MFKRIHEFLGWEDHMQALCPTSEGLKYEEMLMTDVRLMISNI